MKKLIVVGLAVIFSWSCSVKEGPELGDFFVEYVPIESVDLPQEFVLGQGYTIDYTYYRPTTCHVFNDLYYDVEDNVRTIAISNVVLIGGNPCFNLADELVYRSFNFVATSNETYLFKFWKGTNDAGEDVYLEIEVPVIE